MEAKLGLDFTAHADLQELLQQVQNLLPDYHWRPADLFTYIKTESARRLLLKMLEVEISPGSREFDELARGLINGVLVKRKRHEIEEKQGRLKNLTKLEDKVSILSDIKRLQQEIRDLLA